MGNPARIFDEALALEPEQRANLAFELMKSLDQPAEQGVDKAWKSEIASRLEAVREGRLTAVPLRDALERAHERLATHG